MLIIFSRLDIIVEQNFVISPAKIRSVNNLVTIILHAGHGFPVSASKQTYSLFRRILVAKGWLEILFYSGLVQWRWLQIHLIQDFSLI